MNYFRKAVGVLVLASAFVVGSASAEDRDWMKYDGTVSIDATQFALIFGGSSGGGEAQIPGQVL